MRRIDELIFKTFSVPQEEHSTILQAVGPDSAMPSVSKKGVAAWSLLCVYKESPAFVVFGAFCLLFVLPFFIILNLVG